MGKKAIGSIVATALLLVVTIVAIIGYQSWYNFYESNIFVSVEKNSVETNKVQIEALIGNQLYLKNLRDENISINQIIIGNKNCNISKNINYGIKNIDLTDCLDNLSLDNSIVDITIITDKDIITKKHLFKNFSIISSSSQSLEETSLNWFGNGSDGDILVNSSGVYQSFDDGVSYSIVLESTGTQWNSIEDGDMIIINAKDFIVESGVVFSTTNRCRGLMIYATGDMIINGTINMTARGARANPADSTVTLNTPVAPSDGNAVPSEGLVIRRAKSNWSDIDSSILNNAHASSIQDFNSTHNFSDLFFGAGLAAVNAESHQSNVTNGLVIKIPRVGGNGAPRYSTSNGVVNGATSGGMKMNALGGGGNGNCRYGTVAAGGDGTCFSGGSGSGMQDQATNRADVSDYGGSGGQGGSTTYSAGAGNPGGVCTGGSYYPGCNGGDGTGGLLIIFVQKNLNIFGTIESQGVKGGYYGTNWQYSSGGSGGGLIVLTYAGNLTNSGILNVAGGFATTFSGNSGSGGTGSIIGPIKIDS